MKTIKTNLHIEFEFPLYDLFEEGTPKEKMKERIGKHIKKWAKYHAISTDSIKIIPCNKEKR